MGNFEIILRQLAPVLGAVRRCSPDIRQSSRIEFLDDQSVLRTDTIYLAEAAQLTARLKSIEAEPGANLFVCGTDGGEQFVQEPALRNITVAETPCPIGRLYNLLTQAIAQCFEPARPLQYRADAHLQEQLCDFWQSVRSRNLVGRSETKTALQELLPAVKKYYRLLVVNQDEGETAAIPTEVVDGLNEILPACGVFPYTKGELNQVLIIQFFDEQPFTYLEEENAIQELLRENHLHMMVSNSTSDYSRMNTLYRLNSRCCFLAERVQLELETCIYFYERYSMYMVLDMCAQRYMELFGHADILYLVHPVVVHLTRYDEQHHINLRDVLYYYLSNNRDLKRTADVLYMHRNTVLNKLNLIRSICPVDFEDGGLNQRLLFSCQLIRYYERVMSQRLQNVTRSREQEESKAKERAHAEEE